MQIKLAAVLKTTAIGNVGGNNVETNFAGVDVAIDTIKTIWNFS